MTELRDPIVTDASAPGLAGLALDLVEITTALRRTTRRAVRQRVTDSALPHAEVEVLVAVVESPGIGVADAARGLGLAANTVSTLVGRLVEAGLVERSVDPGDRRAAILRATPAGRGRVRRWRNERAELMTHALGALGPDDRHHLLAAVGALRNLVAQLQATAEDAR